MEFLRVEVDSFMKRNFSFQIALPIQVRSLNIGNAILVGWVEEEHICRDHFIILHLHKIPYSDVFPFILPFHKLFVL